MKVHLIAIGGAAMHNLAIALHLNNYTVQGSDDEIYGLSHKNLSKHGLLPSEMGWNDSKIDKTIDFVIVGMHAKKDNPELNKALELGIPTYSYPEFLYRHAKDKKRVVIAGSHGKTTTTSILMHVLKTIDFDFDYLVGAQLEGFDAMVRLSDAPVIVIEGDEYLSSPLDLRPKILHYKPHHACITGVAWDHINVFKTFDIYKHQFELFIESMEAESTLYYYNNDEHLTEMAPRLKPESVAYNSVEFELKDGQTIVSDQDGNKYEIALFGNHNMENLKAAQLLANDIGVDACTFFEAMQSFNGAHKRLQQIYRNEKSVAFHDFAHAPSKLNATVDALKDQFPDKILIACFELHTYSSLNKLFLPLYKDTLEKADIAIVFYQDHTIEMKRLAPLHKSDVEFGFQKEGLKVFKDKVDLMNELRSISYDNHVLAFLSSGNFGGLDLRVSAKQLLEA
jgi:UDP-N-acetylmuramate: L-alanyl-gamma-D-glutamyl-meso-diaminopimelate ligase